MTFFYSQEISQQYYHQINNSSQMASAQQSQVCRKQAEQKEDAVTQAETFFSGEDSKTLIQRVIEAAPAVQQQLLHQHNICTRVSAGTFSADKILRLVSSLIKLIRNYNLLRNLKSLERVGGQIGQLRRLLRVDRVLIIAKEYRQLSSKQRISKAEALMAAFKALILIGDICDLVAYLMQLRVVTSGKLTLLRKYVVNMYFLECLGWLGYHSFLYLNSSDQEGRDKNRTMICKYIMDALTSQNDSTFKILTINPKLTSLIGAVSSLLNLSLIWK